MASGMFNNSNNNNNNSSNNSNNNKRQTGTVPKTKTSRNNSLPQEIVAPTRRNLQQQINELVNWAGLPGNTSTAASNTRNKFKNKNSKDGNCVDTENIPQETSNRFIPVRPILRKKFLPDDNHINELNNITPGLLNSLNTHNTAIGVVIPTTPNTIINDHQILNTSYNFNNHNNNNYSRTVDEYNNILENDNTLQNNLLSQIIHPQASVKHFENLPTKANIEEKVEQIRNYIKITTTLINSIESENLQNYNSNAITIHDNQLLHNTLEKLYLTDAKLIDILNKHYEMENSNNNMHNQDKIDNSNHPINSVHLENVYEPELNNINEICNIANGIQNSSSYKELQMKLENSNRAMETIKEQQNQLIHVQETVKKNLRDMEQLKKIQQHQQQQNTSYDSVEQVEDDVSSIMDRLKTVSTFIEKQNQISKMLHQNTTENGQLNNSDLVDDVQLEQTLLEKKLIDLKEKKEYMENLVTELQNLNVTADKSFHHDNWNGTTPVPAPSSNCSQSTNGGSERIVPIEIERIVPIQLLNAPELLQQHQQRHSIPIHIEHENADEQTSLLSDKIEEINSMKNQLKRLKNMMDTVKLIEIKAESAPPKTIGCEEEIKSKLTTLQNEIKKLNHISRSSTRSLSSERTLTTDTDRLKSEDQDRLNERIQTMEDMTRDIREQAMALVTERERVKVSKDAIKNYYRENDCNSIVGVTSRSTPIASEQQLEKKLNQNNYQHLRETPANSMRERDSLKMEYESKKKEFEKLCVRLDNESDIIPDDKKSSSGLANERMWKGSQGSSLQSNDNASAKLTSQQLAGKESTDSGAVDMLGMSLDAGSFQSDSSRDLSMPPPMHNFDQRPPICRKSSQDNSGLSSIRPPTCYSTSVQDNYYPWTQYYHPSCNVLTGQQSPHCHHNTGANSALIGEHGHCHMHHYSNTQIAGAGSIHQQQPPPLSTQSAPIITNSNESIILQQYVQTQQMLINSISQCNHLLWTQQREINNLNNAVLLLQERILNVSGQYDQNHQAAPTITTRGESVPLQNITGTFIPRAQSEQPSTPNLLNINNLPFFNNNISAGFQQNNSHRNITPYQYSINQTQSGNTTRNNNNNNSIPITVINDKLCRSTINNSSTNNSNNNNNLNNTNNQRHHSLYIQQLQQQQQQQHQYHHNNILSMDEQNDTFTNSLQYDNNNYQPQSQNHLTSSSIFINNTNPNNLNNTINNQLNHNVTQRQPQSSGGCAANANTASTVTSGSSTRTAAAPTNVPPALNNQVAPGNRANNYWDNFRSYSRQNLLSGNLYKNNEETASVCGGAGGGLPIAVVPTISSGIATPSIANIIPPTTTNNIIIERYNNIERNNYHQQELRGNLYSQDQPMQQHLHDDHQEITTINNNNNNNVNNKYNLLQTLSYRNQINKQPMSQQTTSTTNDIVSINQNVIDRQQQQQQQQNHIIETNNLINNLNNHQHNHNLYINDYFNDTKNSEAIATTSLATVSTATATNASINLLMTKLKTLPKLNSGNNSGGSGGVINGIGYVGDNKKRLCQNEETGNNNNINNNSHINNNNFNNITNNLQRYNVTDQLDLNLATSSNPRSNIKSPTKLFDKLRDNVYTEVTALITANESHPKFLIKLFRNLQLISLNEQMHKKILQSLNDLYNKNFYYNNINTNNCNNINNSNSGTNFIINTDEMVFYDEMHRSHEEDEEDEEGHQREQDTEIDEQSILLRENYINNHVVVSEHLLQQQPQHHQQHANNNSITIDNITLPCNQHMEFTSNEHVIDTLPSAGAVGLPTGTTIIAPNNSSSNNIKEELMKELSTIIYSLNDIKINDIKRLCNLIIKKINNKLIINGSSCNNNNNYYKMLNDIFNCEYIMRYIRDKHKNIITHDSLLLVFNDCLNIVLLIQLNSDNDINPEDEHNYLNFNIIIDNNLIDQDTDHDNHLHQQQQQQHNHNNNNNNNNLHQDDELNRINELLLVADSAAAAAVDNEDLAEADQIKTSENNINNDLTINFHLVNDYNNKKYDEQSDTSTTTNHDGLSISIDNSIWKNDTISWSADTPEDVNDVAASGVPSAAQQNFSSATIINNPENNTTNK